MHVSLGKGGIPKKFGKLGQPAIETRNPNGFASEEVRRQVERPTLADVGDKTGVGLPYAAPGKLRSRMRGESRRAKALLMEKIDMSKPSVSALQYETAKSLPRKFQDVVALLTSIVIAPLCPIELLLCLALRWSFSRLDSAGRHEVWLLRSVSSGRPVVRPSGSGLSGRPKARSPRPVRYQGDWSAPKIGGSSGLIGGCQVLFFDSDMRSVFAFGHHPDL
ncbi:hypothetical protein U1Q18_023751 [Sarracenia purpurea var. burkii]